MKPLLFTSPSQGRLTIQQTVKEICNYIKGGPESRYTLVIGTDSHPAKITDFVTAIIIHRQGHGGCYFWRKIKKNKMPTLRQRLYEETLLSIEIAQALIAELNPKFLARYNLEIHIDVGEKGASREMLKEVVGLVRGNGFVAKTKPEAYGASTVADKYT